jgi:peptidoglycan/xylan/chitin deacetylase (PgdA/CDA1 family)/glycosyltransferase involved in cell wall biosynthesis
MRISVVIPAFNESLSISRCLGSLAKQDTGYPFDVIVVDNNSSDGTASVAASFPFVRVVSEPKQGVTRARQAGLARAQGEVVAQTDADTDLPCDWIERIGRAFESDKTLVLVSGPMSFSSGPPVAAAIQCVLNWLVLAWWLLTGRLAVANGCNFAVRREALTEAGGFPTDLPEVGDSRILGRLRRRGRVRLLQENLVRTSSRRFRDQGVLRVYYFYLLEQIASVFELRPERIMSRPAVRRSDTYGRARGRSRRMLLGVPILPLVAIAAGCTYLAINPSSQAYGRIVTHGPRTDNEVALTFDDGPNEPYTSEILAILQHYGVKATFFEVGQNVEVYPDATERLVADGQVIGNHAYDHSRLATAIDLRYRELDQAQAVFEAVAGVSPTLFRPPAGIHTPWQMRTVKGQNMIAVNWDAEGMDWQSRANADTITRRVLDEAQPGSIILLHDGDETKNGADRSATVEALPAIIDGLQQRGYTFVTVPQMLNVPAYQLPESPPDSGGDQTNPG